MIEMRIGIIKNPILTQSLFLILTIPLLSVANLNNNINDGISKSKPKIITIISVNPVATLTVVSVILTNGYTI